jgi:NCS2 family nucleobase:cation symporter-2
LVSADLFCCGVVTIVQCLGFWKIGIRLPIMMGIAFTAVPSIIATGTTPGLGMPGVIGAVIGSGVFTLIVAPYFSRWVRFFPAVVTGTVMLVIGLSLMRVGVNWAAGGQPMIRGPEGMVPNPAYGAPFALAVAAIVLLSILLMTRYLKGFLANLGVLLGIGIGFAIAIAFGKVDFSGVADASWVRINTPLAFGFPVFEFWSTLALCTVMVVMMIEATGQILAVGDMAGRKITSDELARGLRADGFGNVFGGLFNTFTYTTYAQNVGLLQITGVMSRWVVAAGGVILILLGSLPKVAFISASIPSYVIGGAAIVLFGMVSATGVKILAQVDFVHNRLLAGGAGPVGTAVRHAPGPLAQGAGRCWRPHPRGPNRYLAETYLPAHNRRFRVDPAEPGSAFVPWTAGDLAEILCHQEDRVVARNNTVQFGKLSLQIPPSPLRAHYVRATVQVRRYADGRLALFHGPRCIGRYRADGTPVADTKLAA